MRINYGVAQDANRTSRDHMEDFWAAKKIGELFYFAVFDGHMGETVAHRAKNMLHLEPSLSDTSLAPCERLTQAFESFGKKCADNTHCGSTAVALLVSESGSATIAWVGDSFALYATRDNHELLTPAHTMEVEVERSRLEKMGCRKDGIKLRTPDGDTFPMTRVFGDTCLSRYGVIATPQIRELFIEPGSRLLLATDGIHPTPNGKLYQIPPALMRPTTAREAAMNVVKAAKERWGSPDNMTALVIEAS
jgi:serine/threonine protein phosphatase PrpC